MKKLVTSGFRLILLSGAIASVGPLFGTDQYSDKEAVLAADEARMMAWRGGDARQLESWVADDVFIFNGSAPDDAHTGKEEFLQRVRPGGMSELKTVDSRFVRIFGASHDVAVVDANLSEDAGQKKQGYSAIYVKRGANWKLLRYQLSDITLGGGLIGPAGPTGATPPSTNIFGQTALPTGLSGSLADLNPEERVVAERMRNLMDCMDRRNFNAMEALIDENVTYGRAQTEGAWVNNRERYLARKWKEPMGAAPEINGLSDPRVVICGASRDVAVMNLVKADSTGGAIWGLEFTPKWRAISDQQSVWVRSTPTSSDWRLIHNVTAPYLSEFSKRDY